MPRIMNAMVSDHREEAAQRERYMSNKPSVTGLYEKCCHGDLYRYMEEHLGELGRPRRASQRRHGFFLCFYMLGGGEGERGKEKEKQTIPIPS